MKYVAHCITCNKEIDHAANGVWVEAAARNHVKENLTHKVLVGYETSMVGDNLTANGNVVETIDVESVTRARNLLELLRYNSGVKVGSFGLIGSGNEQKQLYWELLATSNETEMESRVGLVTSQIASLLEEHGFEACEEYIESNYAMFNISIKQGATVEEA